MSWEFIKVIKLPRRRITGACFDLNSQNSSKSYKAVL